jgi:hypothetical protein
MMLSPHPKGGGKTVVTNNAIFMGKNVVDFYIKAVYDCDGKGYVSLKTFKIDFLNQGLNSNLTDPEFHLSPTMLRKGA